MCLIDYYELKKNRDKLDIENYYKKYDFSNVENTVTYYGSEFFTREKEFALEKDSLPFYCTVELDEITGSGVFDSIFDIDTKSAILIRHGGNNQEINIVDFFIDKPEKLQKLINLSKGAGINKHCILGYRITKYLNQNKTEYSNDIFIPSGHSKSLKFVDTRIVPGQLYRYNVNIIYLVISTDGKFQIGSIEDTEFSGRLLSFPPMPPQVDIIPYINEPKKVKILFNKQVGSLKETHIPLLDEEDVFVNNLQTSNILLNKDKVLYRSEIPIETYEFFRLEIKPESISDFKNGVRQSTTSFSIEDNLETNKKYYYIFRNKDINGHYSIPTKIYTLEIVEYTDVFYHSFGFYDIPKNNDIFISDEKFNSRISISPSSRQTNFKAEQVNNNGDILNSVMSNVGDGTNSIWGKKVKVRVTSNSTGRKIDFNLKFEKQKE